MIDRSKFKAANVSELSKLQEDVDKLSPSRNNFTNFAVIEDGVNEFRVLPSIDGTSPYVGFCSSILSVKVPDRDDEGNLTGTSTIKNKRVFNATLHSSTMDGDPVSLYMKYVDELIAAKSQADRAKFAGPINGYRSGKMWVPGIKPQTSYICYALQGGEIKRLELRKTWFKEIQRLSVQESQDSALTLDVFSDADQGYPLLITKTIDPATNKTTYSIEAKKPARNQSWEDFYEKNMVPDEVLAKLETLPTLNSLFVNSYTKKDWDMELDGLKRFDEAHPEYGIFNNPDFIKELEELSERVPTDKKKEVWEENTKTVKPETEEVQKEVGATPIQMRKALKEYIEENYPDKSLPNLTPDQLKTWYELTLKYEELPWEDVSQSKVEEASAPTPQTGAKDKDEVDEQSDALARIRAMRQARRNE